MELEPVSVRIARLRGCEPSIYAHGLWHCNCEDLEHGNPRVGDSLLCNYTRPAAAFALLSEMVEANQRPRASKSVTGYFFVTWGDRGQFYSLNQDTLGEAIALAWCAWKEASR